MKLIVDIPDEDYKLICKKKENAIIAHDTCRRITNGIPLPKDHGRLIDADELDRIMYHKAFETDSDMQKWDSGCWIRYKMFENSMEEMPTIIEADKGE